MKTTYNQVMIDIETLATSSDAVILSVAAVYFNMKTGGCRETFYKVADLHSCVNLGMKFDPDTIIWWMRQSDEARKVFSLREVFDIKDILSELADFLKRDSTEVEIWANSPQFDLAILRNAYDLAGIPVPWTFRNERCVRTLAKLVPEIKENYTHIGVEHDALSDCLRQIGYCHKTWKRLFKNR